MMRTLGVVQGFELGLDRCSHLDSSYPPDLECLVDPHYSSHISMGC